ncbi:MAG: tRNA pseudouridine(38-40) synthase TruA [Saccharofermentans sp.]|nr:tRNA pseudouridine(38-40) synthase TruA [Saccharofermentans sp.]
MPRLALVVEYDGTDLAGFQVQDNGRTVAGELNKAASALFKEDIKVTGCSRTDSGVHARCHLSHLDVPFIIPEENVPLAMNALLPEDVKVKEAYYTGEDFNARFDTTGKKYIYRIYNSRTPSPLNDRYSYFCPYNIDVSRMQEAAGYFEGEHDFRAFCAAGGSQKTYDRLIYKVSVTKVNENQIEIEVSGQAFLYNMVRIIAGTLLSVGIGDIEPSQIPEIINSGDRKRAGKTLPAKGLTLEEVFWDKSQYTTDFSPKE